MCVCGGLGGWRTRGARASRRARARDSHGPLRYGHGCGAGGRWGGVNRVLHTLHTLHTFFREKGREDLNLFFSSSALKKKSETPRDFGSQNSAQTLQTVQNPCGFCGVQPGAHTTPPPLPGCRCVWVGHEGHEVHLLPTDVAGAEHVRVLPQGPLGPPAPRGPRASNLVGPVRGVIGLVGWRGLFQAVRHIGRKWATCTPSAPPRPPWTPQTSMGHARRARRRSKAHTRGARVGGGVSVVSLPRSYSTSRVRAPFIP